MKSKSGSGQNLCKRLARQTGTENVSMHHIYYECLIRLLNGSLYIKMPFFFLVSLIQEPAVWFESVKAIFLVRTITDGQCFKFVWTIAFHQFVCSAHVTSVGKSKKINEKKRSALIWEALRSHSETQSLKAELALKRYATTLALTNRLCPAVIRRFVVVWLRSTQWGLPSEGLRQDNRTSLDLPCPLRVRRSTARSYALGMW